MPIASWRSIKRKCLLIIIIMWWRVCARQFWAVLVVVLIILGLKLVVRRVLLKIHMADAAQQMETGTSAHARKKLVKLSKNAHVDGVAAILDALCMRANKWTELGAQLQNKG